VDYFTIGWLTALVSFVLGAGIGILLYRVKFSDNRRTQQLQKELEAVTAEFERYKKSVTDHFNETSELVSDLTENYVKVYQHLSKSAAALGDVQITPQLSAKESGPMITFMNEVDEAANPPDDEQPFEPPKDYAPKEQETEGTLSESYSVNTGEKTEEAEKKSA